MDMEKINLCKCNMCDGVFLDTNPQIGAKQYEFTPKQVGLFRELDDHKCPDCKVDDYLDDKELSGRDLIPWTCTDPDNEQYGRKIASGHYEFKERGEQADIKLSDYSDERKESTASSYNGSLAEMKEIYGESTDTNSGWEWILAECIFEEDYSPIVLPPEAKKSN